jgi:hypothetical protein
MEIARTSFWKFREIETSAIRSSSFVTISSNLMLGS